MPHILCVPKTPMLYLQHKNHHKELCEESWKICFFISTDFKARNFLIYKYILCLTEALEHKSFINICWMESQRTTDPTWNQLLFFPVTRKSEVYFSTNEKAFPADDSGDNLGFLGPRFPACVLDTSNMSSWKLLVTKGRNSERKGTASCRASGNKG